LKRKSILKKLIAYVKKNNYAKNVYFDDFDHSFCAIGYLLHLKGVDKYEIANLKFPINNYRNEKYEDMLTGDFTPIELAEIQFHNDYRGCTLDYYVRFL
jgi:hypothetical protein